MCSHEYVGLLPYSRTFRRFIFGSPEVRNRSLCCYFRSSYGPVDVKPDYTSTSHGRRETRRNRSTCSQLRLFTDTIFHSVTVYHLHNCMAYTCHLQFCSMYQRTSQDVRSVLCNNQSKVSDVNDYILHN